MSFRLFRFIYWTDGNNRAPRIERSYTDGTHRQILVQDRLRSPQGIAVDTTGMLLPISKAFASEYWETCQLIFPC